MNIFILDKDPKICAQYHNDKHVVKMILETAQLLCTAHWETGTEAPYKSTHKNHPCAVWVRECVENYNWLCDLGVELCIEYTYRYSKRHKSQDIIEWCKNNIPNIKNIGGLTDFKLAMPNDCKIGDAVTSYREYYINEKKHFSKWKNREVPFFMKNNKQIS